MKRVLSLILALAMLLPMGAAYAAPADEEFDWGSSRLSLLPGDEGCNLISITFDSRHEYGFDFQTGKPYVLDLRITVEEDTVTVRDKDSDAVIVYYRNAKGVVKKTDPEYDETCLDSTVDRVFGVFGIKAGESGLTNDHIRANFPDAVVISEERRESFLYRSSIPRIVNKQKRTVNKTTYFEHSDSYFINDNGSGRDSYTYNHDLAKLSLATSMAAFNSADVIKHHDYREASVNIQTILVDMGFSDIDFSAYKWQPSEDTIGYAFATKDIYEDGEHYTLVAIAIRGGGYEAEWASNFDINNNYYHKGFTEASDKILEALERYLWLHVETKSNTKFWVTGYSRGAAVANIVAAKLDDISVGKAESLNYLKPRYNIDASHIYAYTFATPQGMYEGNNDQRYYNIHNVVNPIDLVPKVAFNWQFRKANGEWLINWNFFRYGKTYYLPAYEYDAEYYQKYAAKVGQQYQALCGEHLGSVAFNASVEMLDQLTLCLALATKSAESEFSIKLQQALRKAVISFYESDDGYNDAHELWSVIRKTYKAVKNGKKVVDAIEFYTNFKSWLVGHMNDKFLWDPAKEWFSWKADTAFVEPHYPELYLAWMRSIDGEEDYVEPVYRVGTTACPVDVYVYDSKGTLIAKIIDDQVVQFDGCLPLAYVIEETGEKRVVLPTNDEYRVELIATGDGEMDYSVKEYDSRDHSVNRLVNYQDVPISTGEKLLGVVENLEDVNRAAYPLYRNSTEPISSDINLGAGEVDRYAIGLSIEGNGEVTGSGLFVTGEYTALQATPGSGEQFLGWYIRDRLVSSDPVYSFRVEESVDFIGKFTNNAASQGSSSGSGSGYIYSLNISLPEGYYVRSLSVSGGVVQFALNKDDLIVLENGQRIYPNADNFYVGDADSKYEGILMVESNMKIPKTGDMPIWADIAVFFDF